MKIDEIAGVARGEKGSKDGGGWVSLSNVDARKLAGFKDELIWPFILAADMVEGGIWEFVNDTDGPAFLRELVGLDVDGYW